MCKSKRENQIVKFEGLISRMYEVKSRNLSEISPLLTKALNKSIKATSRKKVKKKHERKKEKREGRKQQTFRGIRNRTDRIRTIILRNRGNVTVFLC